MLGWAHLQGDLEKKVALASPVLGEEAGILANPFISSAISCPASAWSVPPAPT